MDSLRYGEEVVKVVLRCCDVSRLPTWYSEDEHYLGNLEDKQLHPNREDKWFKVLVALMNPAEHWLDIHKVKALSAMVALGNKVVLVDGYPDVIQLQICRAIHLDNLAKSGTIITSTVAQEVNEMNFQHGGVRYVYTDDFREFSNALLAEEKEKNDCHRVINLATADAQMWTHDLFPILKQAHQDAQQLQAEGRQRMEKAYADAGVLKKDTPSGIIQ